MTSLVATLAHTSEVSGPASLPVEKRCRTCKEFRPVMEFPRHMGARDQRRSTCRSCLLSGRYEPYIEPPEIRARRKVRESRPKWQRSHRKALARHAERNPLAEQAKRALQAALKVKRIVKANHCQVQGCTSQRHLEAHHWSYAPEHRTDVLWCCAAHHRQGHARGFIVPAEGIPSYYGTIPEMVAEVSGPTGLTASNEI